MSRRVGAIDFFSGGKAVGHMFFVGQAAGATKVNSTNPVEQITLARVWTVGTTIPVPMTLGGSCGPGCRNADHYAFTLRFTLHYASPVAAGQVRFNTPRHFWNAGPGGTQITQGVTFRCDNKNDKWGAGCVYAEYTPTMTQMRQLHFISAGIRKAQAGGSPKLLHRQANKEERKKNHDRVCSSRLNPPPGTTSQPGWPKGEKPTCVAV